MQHLIVILLLDLHAGQSQLLPCSLTVACRRRSRPCCGWACAAKCALQVSGCHTTAPTGLRPLCVYACLLAGLLATQAALDRGCAALIGQHSPGVPEATAGLLP